MKKSIITASLKSFLKYGFNKTTMDQIAKGTLYLYFKSKDDLISNITELHFQKIRNDLIPKKYCQIREELLAYIKNALLINEEDSKFIPIFFEAFGSKLSSDVLSEEY